MTKGKMMENTMNDKTKTAGFKRYQDIKLGKYTIFAKPIFKTDGNIRYDRINVDPIGQDGTIFQNTNIRKPTKGVHVSEEEYSRGVKLLIEVFKTSPESPHTMAVIEILDDTRTPTHTNIEKYALSLNFEDKISLIKALKRDLLKEVI